MIPPRHIALAIAGLAATCSHAANMQHDWENLAVNSWNCEPARTYSVPLALRSLAGSQRPHARTRGCRRRRGYPATRLRESKRTSFPWEGYGFWRPSVVHATAQPSPTPHCRSKRTEPGAFTSANHNQKMGKLQYLFPLASKDLICHHSPPVRESVLFRTILLS